MENLHDETHAHNDSAVPARSGPNPVSVRPAFSTRMTVGTSILILFALATVGGFFLNSFRENLYDVLLAQQQTLTSRAASEVDHTVLTLQRVLITSAKDVSPKDIASADAAQHFLDTNPGLRAVFDRSVFLFSASGKLIAEHPYLPNRRGSDFSWRDYIRDTVSTKKPVISKPIRTIKDDGHIVIMLTAPIFSQQGDLMAILGGSIDLTSPGMMAEIADTVIGKTGYLYLVASDGKLILHPDRATLSRRAFDANANPLFERILKGDDGAGIIIDQHGRKVLSSFKHLPSTKWIIAAAYPEREAFAPYYTLVRDSLKMLLAASVFAITAVWILTRNMVQDINLLVQKLRTSNASLKRMRADAITKLETRSRFFQEASHDFRQRLHAIQLLTHALKTEQPGADGTFLRLSSAVADLQMYIKHFLEFAKLESSSMTPRMRVLHLQDIFQKIELQFEDVALNNGIDLKMRATAFQVLSDEAMLLRIIENLVSNAIKFARGKVIVGARRSGKYISVEIRDNGHGFARADAESIFEAFYQGSAYVDPRQEGVGLGLSIVKRFADCLDCTVSIIPKEGIGTLTRVLIPIEPSRETDVRDCLVVQQSDAESPGNAVANTG